MVEVLIIGAGPAGSAAAIHLAREGRDVLLIDRARFPRRKPCGEYYNPECTRQLRELGVLESAMRAGGRPVNALSFGSGCAAGLTIPFAEVAPGGEPAFTIAREVLDSLLLEAARAAGVTVQEGVTAREPLVEGRGVRGAILRVDGIDRPVRSEVTLGADGLRSRFARRLELAARPARRRKLGIAGRYRVGPGAGETVDMHSSATGCCGLVVRGSEANLGMVVDAARAREIGGDPRAFFQRELQRYPGLTQHLNGPPESTLAVGPLTWTTRRQHAAGCLLLGDAAGFYDPFTGQGVTFALLTARLAADVAREAFHDRDFSARKLAEYSRRRRVLLGPKVWVQQAIQAVIERPDLRDHVLRRLGQRPETARTLAGVIADVAPAWRAFSPGFLARLVI